jgi:hypothetical protein
MKFTADFKCPRIVDYKSFLDKFMQEVLKEAVKTWLQATVIAEVPVWSGASQATFVKLATAVDESWPILPEVPSRIPQGTSESTGQLEVTGNQYLFSYSTTLPWLITNEYTDATQFGIHLRKPGPYDFQTKGVVAFLQYSDTVQLPLPPVSVFTITA